MCFWYLNKRSDILKQEILKYVIFHKDAEKNFEKISGFKIEVILMKKTLTFFQKLVQKQSF